MFVYITFTSSKQRAEIFLDSCCRFLQCPRDFWRILNSSTSGLKVAGPYQWIFPLSQVRPISYTKYTHTRIQNMTEGETSTSSLYSALTSPLAKTFAESRKNIGLPRGFSLDIIQDFMMPPNEYRIRRNSESGGGKQFDLFVSLNMVLSLSRSIDRSIDWLIGLHNGFAMIIRSDFSLVLHGQKSCEENYMQCVNIFLLMPIFFLMSFVINLGKICCLEFSVLVFALNAVRSIDWLIDWLKEWIWFIFSLFFDHCFFSSFQWVEPWKWNGKI